MDNSLYICKGQEIKLEVHGQEMEDGYNLYYLNRTLSNLEGIIDKAYLTYFPDKSKITEKDRQSFQIKVLSFQEGSLITNMMILFMAANQATLSFGIPLTPQSIWNLCKQAYEYLKFVLDAFDKGQPIQTCEGDNGMNIVVSGNNNNIIVLPQAQSLAKNAIEEINSLASSIDEQGGIREIRILDDSIDSQPIIFDEKTKNLFKHKKRLAEQPASIAAEIFQLNGYTLTGKLRVIDSEDPHVKPGNEYSFTLEEEYILEMCKQAFMERATITALKEMVFSPSELNEALNRLKIISIAV